MSVDDQPELRQILQKTLWQITICFISVFLGYFLILMMIKADIKDQLLLNIGIILFVFGYIFYVLLSQQIAIAFEKNKGLNFLEIIFFPFGLITNYFRYRKKISQLLKSR
jgi:hypothetical protein